MAEYTTNYNLVKPGLDETADIEVINGNMDTIDSTMAGMKTQQTSVTDPTASGTATAFIATITQNQNGVITPTKKSVATLVGATSSVAGSAGLVPAPATADRTKFLKGNGTWDTPTDTTYDIASDSTAGLIKTGYTTSDANRNYAVDVNSSGKAYVHVGWTDTTYSTATDSTAGLVKLGYSESGKNYALHISGGRAYVTVPWTDTKYNAATDSALGLIKTGYSESGKYYAVKLNSSNKAYVYVPWQNTTYSAASSSSLGLIKTGYSQTGTKYPVSLDSNDKAYVNVPWTDTDVRNTAGSTNTSSKIFLVGATSQAANPQTYSHDTAYVGTDGCLYSNSSKTVTVGDVKNNLTTSSSGYVLDARQGKALSDLISDYRTTVNGTARAVQIKTGTITGLANNTVKSVSFDSAFSSSCFYVLAQNNVTGFAAAQSICISDVTKNGFKISQVNTSAVASTLTYIAFGY